MIASRLILKNWRNFREVDVPLRERTYLLGPNASGKSNFLDVFRFLRDISKAQGGGLQKAISDRGDVPKLRCLHARRDPEVRIEIHLNDHPNDEEPTWRYVLGFRPEGKRTLISTEEVWKHKEKLLARPDKDDLGDKARLTQTHLEQIQSNAEFREIAEFLAATTYLHLVPQLLKFGDRIGGHRLEEDPFGQGFLERLAKTSPQTRKARLGKIERALSHAIPQFQELRFVQDRSTGRPHLERNYTHHRPQGAWQREDQFSDGTLRLIALLWSILEGDSLLLLEEPELSLNHAIVEQIPLILQKAQQEAKRRRQVIISTHSHALLSNKGIDARGVLLFEPGPEGTNIRPINPEEAKVIQAGFSIAETIMPKTRPNKAQQLSLW